MPDTLGLYHLMMGRQDGKSPAELRVEAESRVAELEAENAALRKENKKLKAIERERYTGVSKAFGIKPPFERQEEMRIGTGE